MLNIVLKKVETDSEIENLRNIRNQCKDFMTRHNKLISPEEHISWFYNNKDLYKIYLLHVVELGVVSYPVGYGLIRIENEVNLISGGLEENFRGKGYGKALFQFLIENCDKNYPIKLEVLKSNNKAFGLYNSLGFRVYEDDGKVIKMEYHNDSAI